MKVGDVALYWPKWHPMESSDPEGPCLILDWDDDEAALYESKPPQPQWLVMTGGEIKWVSSWQVQKSEEK